MDAVLAALVGRLDGGCASEDPFPVAHHPPHGANHCALQGLAVLVIHGARQACAHRHAHGYLNCRAIADDHRRSRPRRPAGAGHRAEIRRLAGADGVPIGRQIGE